MNNPRLSIVARFAAAFPVTVLLVAALPTAVSALPPEQSATDSVDDALVELTVLDQHIRGDTRSWCRVRINVLGTDVMFTTGDRIFLWVYEDDILGDDELWSTSFDVTAAEVSAQLVDRTLDCVSDFGSDASPTLEIYASARVEKAACGTFCVWDRPATAALDVSENDDDSTEDDDTASTAVALPPGTPASRIAIDTDYHEVTLVSPSIIELTTFYRPAAGRVDAELLDSSETLLLASTDQPGGGALTSAALTAGTYYVRVTPRAPPDSQFYDLVISLSSTSCAAGATEMRPCEMCGTERRLCEGSVWGAWGACMMQGECIADAMETRACGGGGIEARTCSSTCTWAAYGMCMGMRTDDDAGMDTDGGTPGRDAGVPPPSDGGDLPDAGGGRDGGPGSMDGGCSCRSASGGRAAPMPFVLALAALPFVRRCRRRVGRKAADRS